MQEILWENGYRVHEIKKCFLREKKYGKIPRAWIIYDNFHLDGHVLGFFHINNCPICVF